MEDKIQQTQWKKAKWKGEWWIEKENFGTGNFLERKRTGYKFNNWE